MFETLEYLSFVVPTGYPDNVNSLHITSTTAVISWSPVPIDQQNGIIIGYTINVTDIQSEETFQLAALSTRVTLDMLAPFTTYLVVVDAFNNVGSGPSSTPHTFTTKEDGVFTVVYILLQLLISMLCLQFTVPSLAPSNTVGRVVDSHTILLSWAMLPPEHHNGILQGYNITITERETGLEFHYLSASSMLTIPSLHPAYLYEWSVAAFTRIGRGPFSFPLSRIQTLEDGN